MNNNKPNYWFPAKRYGWGWGIPSTWQGWVVLIGFVILLALGSAFFPPTVNVVAYLLYTLGLSAVLIGICYLKGEPPKWRWGKD